MFPDAAALEAIGINRMDASRRDKAAARRRRAGASRWRRASREAGRRRRRKHLDCTADEEPQMRGFKPSSAPVSRACDKRDIEAIAALHTDSWRRHYRGAYSDAFLDGDIIRRPPICMD